MKLSIIIPTFNRRQLLELALDSILKQSYRNIEVLVVDDGSTDDTSEFMTSQKVECGATDMEGKLFYLQQQHQGAPAARNLGVTRATGEFFLFMDSDDLLAKDGLAAIMAHFSQNDVDFLHAKVLEIDGTGAPVGRDAIGRQYAESGDGLMNYSWHTMGAVYSRACIERVGPWETCLRGSQDWEYQVRVKLFGGKNEFVDEVIGYWRQHDMLRVGTAVFRPEYVKSVMKACSLVARNARRAGRYDDVLKARIAKRLLVHSVEWGSAGQAQEKEECLTQAADTYPSNTLFQLAIKALRMSPQPLDHLIDISLRRLQNRP
jgi:glycosyltransferase involved in cell wall biosynthesis